MVTTYWPSGETCDMKPKRFAVGPSVFTGAAPGNAPQRMTSSLRMVISFWTLTSAYRPLSFCGPSMSSPSVLPSSAKEWQLAQVGRPCMMTLLCGSLTFRKRQAISPMAECGSGLDDAVHGRRRDQRHVPVEDRRTHRILRCLNGDVAASKRRAFPLGPRTR